MACSTGLIFFGNQAKYSGDCRVLGCVAYGPCQCHGEALGSSSGLLPTACYHSCPPRPHSKPHSACSSWMPILKSPCFREKQPPSHLLSLLHGGPQILAVNPRLKSTSQILLQGRRITPSHGLQGLSWFQSMLLHGGDAQKTTMCLSLPDPQS